MLKPIEEYTLKPRWLELNEKLSLSIIQSLLAPRLQSNLFIYLFYWFYWQKPFVFSPIKINH